MKFLHLHPHSEDNKNLKSLLWIIKATKGENQQQQLKNIYDQHLYTVTSRQRQPDSELK